MSESRWREPSTVSLPRPQVMTERTELFWGMTASMWIGNLLLALLIVVVLPAVRKKREEAFQE